MLQLEVIGNLGGDAVLKEIGGRKYVSFSVAHTERHKNPQGMAEESTTWVSVLWNGENSGLTPYLRKGTKVFCRGRMSCKAYTDKNNFPQAGINMYASEVVLCGSKDEAASQQNAETSVQAATAQSVVQAAVQQPMYQPENTMQDDGTGLPF